MLHLNGVLREHLALRAQAQENFERAVREVQSECKHEKVGEAPYQPEGTFTYTLSPFRVCMQCGVSEEGWSFKVLTNEFLANMSRADGYRYRLGDFLNKREDD